MSAEQHGEQTGHRPVRSYVLRQGRTTRAQQHALDHYWSRFGIDYARGQLSAGDIFGDDHPTTLEIGFGNGDSLLEQATRHPEQNFIGIEVHGPGVGHLIHHAYERELSNLRVIRHDAVEVLKHQLAPHSMAAVQLFFPDPWHKKRHHKRRIVNDEFLGLVHRILQPGGLFHLATDWQDYAQSMLAQLEADAHFINASGPGKYADNAGERGETRFERRGRRLGHGVWDLMYRSQPG